MFASEELIAAFNRQIGNEMGASLQYISIASYFARETLPEMAAVFYDQANEEHDHAMRFVHFVTDVDGRVEIPALEAPQSEFSSAEECVALSLEWEREVTRQINDLVKLASGEDNQVALRFLDFFVSEQLEEVKKMSDLLTMVQRAGEGGLFLVESYLASKGGASPETAV